MDTPGSNPNRPPFPSPGSGRSVPAAGRDASTLMLAELMAYQRQVGQLNAELGDLRAKLGRRSHQMAVLQHVSEILAATPKVAAVASVLQDLFVQEFGARTCIVWAMEEGGTRYLPKAGHGIAHSVWSRLALPAPNPFPLTPLVLFQNQWLDKGFLFGPLESIASAFGESVFFVPFEHQLLLMGFALLGFEPSKKLEPEDADTIAILQRQVAVSIYNAWLFRDLQEQRDALRTKTAELEEANTALRDADRFKSEFLALTSHELRTPLTGLLGFTRLVLDGLYEDEAEMKRMLQDSYGSGLHLLNLLNDILDLAKIESGRMPMHLEPWSLHILIEELKPLAEAYPRKPDVAIIWPEHLRELPEVMIDPGRLKQVLLNLLSNALKFTPKGTVTLAVERGIGAVTLRIVDTGIGVTSENQKRLFQKFVQAEGGHAREYGGTGLGLVICKHLLEMMNGTITLASEGLGQGTTLTLTVPIA